MSGSSWISPARESISPELLDYAGVTTLPRDATLPRGAIVPRGDGWTARRSLYMAAKRGVDILVSVVALIVLAPVLMLTAVLIKLRDGGPIFFVQKRVRQERPPVRLL